VHHVYPSIHINPLTLIDLIHLPVDKIISLDGNSKAQVVTYYVRVYDKRREEIYVYAFKVKKKCKQVIFQPNDWV